MDRDRLAIRWNQCDRAPVRSPHLEPAPEIKEQIFRLDIPMGDSFSVEVTQTSEELLEAAFHFGSAHATFANGSIQISTCAKLHDFAPGMVFVLQKVDRLDNIGVMKDGRNAKLRGDLLDVLPFSLTPSAFPKLLEGKGIRTGASRSEQEQADQRGRGGRPYLDSINLFLGPIPLVHKTDDASSTPSNRDLATNTVFLGEITLARREAGCSV